MLRLANFIIDENLQSPVKGDHVPKDVALKLIQQYRDSGGWAGCATRAIWFSKDDFIKMIGMIAGIEGGDGMKVYIAKYPPEKLPGDYDHEKCKNRMTVVFVPTKNGKKDIFDVNQPPSSAQSGSTTVPSSSNTTVSREADEDEEGYNHGELHP